MVDFSNMNISLNNITKTGKTTSEGQLTRSPPLEFKSNSLFAYQEFDKYSSFCDNETFPLSILNYIDNNQNSHKNNSSTKQEDFEDSISDKGSINNEKSGDENFLKQYEKRRKSAFNSMPYFFQNIGSIKPNEINYGNEQIINNNLINNNYLNKDKYLLNNIQNIRRNSQQINQFQNSLNFKNILDNRQQNSFGNLMFPKNNINCINTNPLNNININNNIVNYMNGYIYNNFNNNNNNNIQVTKKRNSMFLQQTVQQENQRSLSYNSIPQILNSADKKGNNVIIEENPDYFLKDQLYCRQIQTKLENNMNDKNYIEEFYLNIKSRIIEIIEHQFGNYVIQKFLSVLIFQQNKELFTKVFHDINNELFEICIDIYGTRVIQKTLEKLGDGNYSKIETEELNQILKNVIENHLYELCCDKNGNHVYQKILKIFPREKNQFLFDAMKNICLQVAIIQQGATLLQVVFDNGTKEQNENICLVIVEHIENLINDRYGNYTIQTLYKLHYDNINNKIYKYIEDNILTLSKGKFSSNVIDKLIIKDNINSNKIIEAIINKHIIKEIICDQYGNYVIQKALSISDKYLLDKIMQQIKPIVGDLQKTSIGKKVYEKIYQNYKSYFI